MMDARRHAMLEAMGVEVLALRTRVDAHADACMSADDAIASPPAGGHARLCIVCAHGVRSEPRLARLLAQIARALTLAPAAIGWIEASASGSLPAPPAAPAYLVLGAAIAPRFGAQLSTTQQNAAVIAVSEAATLPGAAAGKRALWQVLKPIARRLAAEPA